MVFNLFADRGARAESLRRLIDLENEFSPQEMSELWQNKAEIPKAIIGPFKKTIKMMALGSKQFRAFERTKLSTNVNFYRTQGEAKSLLIAFCGIVNRLMMPIPVFLQFVPETEYDVLLLKDPSRAGYIRGVPGFGEDLARVAEAIRSDIDLRSYREIRCLGTSAGGQAALYLGLLLDARRAVSIAGRHRSLSKAVAEGGGQFTGEEMDELIRDIGPKDTELLNVFGERCPRDVEGAVSLQKVLPRINLVEIPGLADHNVLGYLLDKGALPGFMSRTLLSESAR